MAKIILILIFLLIIFMTSCAEKSSSNTSPHSDYNYEIPEVISSPNMSNPLMKKEIKNYSGYHDMSILHIETQYKPRIIDIINTINPEYFKGLSELTFIYSNKIDARRTVGGWYYPDNKAIVIYFYDESDEYIKTILLHELKHHHCFINTGDAMINHDGCFLDTPIDEEYGFIR